MKKFVLISLFCICSVFAVRGLAAEASPDEVSAVLLKEWVSEKYGCKIDKDGDLIINGRNGKIFVAVIPKVKLIRIYSSFSRYDKRSVTEMKALTNNRRVL